MSVAYFFSIRGQQAGPFDDAAIRAHIAAGDIDRRTLTWHTGMASWQPAQQIAEFLDRYGDALPSESQPPPLPGDGQADTAAPPPLPDSKPAAGAPGPETAAPDTPKDGLTDMAYRFVMWGYRSRRGGKSPVCDYVRADPKRAVPVAALTLLAMALIVALGFSWVPGALDDNQGAQTVPTVQQGYPPAGGMENYRIWKDTHDYNQRILDDTYKSNSDAFNRTQETYRRGTYDWYNDKD